MPSARTTNILNKARKSWLLWGGAVLSLLLTVHALLLSNGVDYYQDTIWMMADLPGFSNNQSIFTSAAPAATLLPIYHNLPLAEQSTTSSVYFHLHVPKVAGNSFRTALHHRLRLELRDLGPCNDQMMNHTNLTDILQKIVDPDECPDCRLVMSEGCGFRQMLLAREQQQEQEDIADDDDDESKNSRIEPALRPTTSHVISFSIMLRDPTHHVVSQYFHCLEATGRLRQRASRSPIRNVTLTQWLEYWHAQHQYQQTHGHIRDAPSMHFKHPTFRCFSPLNLVSWLTGYQNSVYLGQPLAFYQNHFHFVGDMDNLIQSICLFHTQATQHVAPQCNCTTNSNTTGIKKMANALQIRRASHGVQHHGSSHDLNDYQRALIHNMTQQDRQLYDTARRMFQQQVQQMQERFQVTLCGDAQSIPLIPKEEKNERRQK